MEFINLSSEECSQSENGETCLKLIKTKNKLPNNKKNKLKIRYKNLQ